MVIQQHDHQLEALLDRGGYLRGHHQVRAVADHHVYLARRGGHLHAQAPGDLVAHAGVAVLQVIAFGVSRAPELVQVPRQAARRADHDVLGLRQAVHRSDDLALTQGRTVPDAVDAVHFRSPFLPQSRDARSVFVTHTETLEPFRELLEGYPGVRDQRQRAVLAGVHLRHVDVHELHAWMLEGGLGGGGEVAEPGAEGDHQVRLPRDAVGGQRPRDADAAQVLRVVERQRALARLRLCHRDSSLRRQPPQGIRRLAVVDAATGYDQRSET